MVSENSQVKEVMSAITMGSKQIALVMDGDTFLGVVTDGDIRNAIVKGAKLEDPIREIYNTEPVVLQKEISNFHSIELMKKYSIRHLPVIDESKKLKKVLYLEDLVNPPKRKNKVVLMAGGMGTRLFPFTENCPKPLLDVAGKPILEWIMTNMMTSGFTDFVISVNYKANMIKQYFGNGSRWGASISYVEESEKMGTAGSLSLMKEMPEEPMIVMNGDIISFTNFSAVVDEHIRNHADMTVCSQNYEYQVPYGVINIESDRVVAISEKPKHSVLISAGIYVISPSVLNLVRESYMDMPELIHKLVESNKVVKTYLIQDPTFDVGDKNTYLDIQNKFSGFF